MNRNHLWIALLSACGTGAGVNAADSLVIAAASPKIPKTPAEPAPQKQDPQTDAAAEPALGLVNAEMVNIRSGPGTNYGIITALKRGESLQIETTHAGWHTIKWPENLPVWALKDGIQWNAGDHDALVKVQTIVRGNGTRKADPLCTLDVGTKVAVLEEVNGWLKIKAPDSLRAFISARYVAVAPLKSENKTAVAAAPEAKAAEPAKENAPASFESKNTAHALDSKCCAVPITPSAVEPVGAAAAQIPEAKAAEPEKPIPEPAPKIASAAEIIAEKPAETPARLEPTPAPTLVQAAAPAPAPEPAPAVAAAVAPAPAPAVVEKAPAPIVPAAALPPAPPPVTTLSAARELQPESHYGALHLNDRTFRDVVENKGLAMVDFNAQWCGPCRRMSPVVDSIAENMRAQAAIAKLDIDESPATARRFGVNRIPCLILFRDGQEIARQYGSQDRSEVESWIQSH